MSLINNVQRTCSSCNLIEPFAWECPNCGCNKFELKNHYIEKPEQKKKRPYLKGEPKQSNLF